MRITKLHRYTKVFFTLFLFAVTVNVTHAATMRVSPDTGVYGVGSTFAAKVSLNTSGQPVNAAEGSLSFNPKELSVVNVSRSGSIFNLWTQEPEYSNSAGTITFGGGSPTGYTGSTGNIMSVTFRTLNAGTPKISFVSGSVLAADGLGTNVLTGMTGGTYTVTATAAEPAAEPVYVPPVNTPRAPVVTSSTHGDTDGWYATSTAVLTWNVPSDVTSVRTLLNENPNTIPSKVYDDPITNIVITDLDEGISYFHIQFRNIDGWGAVTHYRLGVDTQPPASFEITEPQGQNLSIPERILLFNVADISPVLRFLVQIDGGEPIEYIDTENTGEYALPNLLPGRHTVIVEGFDSAGNSLIGTYAFDVISFEAPKFTEYPSRINTEVIPVFKGETRPNAEVTVTVTSSDGVKITQTVTSDDVGVFIFIPEQSFAQGVYEMNAIAIDEFGAQSDQSDVARFVVDQPGYIRIGTFFVSFLSILVPGIALMLVLIFGTWYLWHVLGVWRKRVIKETKEAEYSLAVEFDAITSHLGSNITKLKKSRKGKLTKAESALIDVLKEDIDKARSRIHKEIKDIDDVVE